MEGRSFASTSLTATGSCLKPTEGSYGRPGVERVEERLGLHDLENLLYWFNKHKPPPPRPPTANEFIIALPPDKKKRRKSGLMTPGELKDTLAAILDTRSYDGQLDNLFAKLDTSGDGFVDWNEFSTYLLIHLRENDFLRTAKLLPLQSETRLRHITNCRQDTTTRILSLNNPTKFITVSKEGIMNVWSPSLANLTAYNLNESSLMTLEVTGGASSARTGPVADDRSTKSGRRVLEWITDATYLWNCHRIAVSSTGRDIRFYDTTMSSHFYEEYNLFGLPDAPTCLYYWHCKGAPTDEAKAGPGGTGTGEEGKALLLFGDDQGHLHILTFYRTSSRLFSQPYRKEEGTKRVYFPHLHNEAGWVTHTRLDFHHVEPIRKVMYLADSQYVAASTGSSRASIVIVDVQGKKKSYSFNIAKGVECFDYSRLLNVLVAGSSDHVVRLFNPYVTSRPVAILQGHALGIVDVLIYEPLSQIFSLSRDAVLRVWDIRDQTCIQTVLIKFHTGYLQRVPDYGSFPTHLYQGATKSLLVAANDQLAVLKMGQVKQVNSGQSQTHTAAICGAIYNPRFKQIITAAEDSSVGLWDVETGAKSVMFTNAHNGESITSLALDSQGKRLITGAINGTVKIWNVQNGHCLHQLEAIDENEITGIIHVADRKTLLTVGWNRKIVQYPDSDPDAAYVKADVRWRAGQLHDEDILTVTYSPPNLLATGTFNGDIFIWFIETEALYKKISHPLHPVNRSTEESRSSKSTTSKTAPQSALTSAKSRDMLSQPGASSEVSARGMADGNHGIGEEVTAGPEGESSKAEKSNEALRSAGRLSGSMSRQSRPKSRRRSARPTLGHTTVAIDKLLFLNQRIKVKRSDSAILVSSEAGYLRWWNVFGSKQLCGYYYGASKEDESILSLASDGVNSLLVAGDTTGRITIWKIDEFCREWSDEIVTTTPDRHSDWTGHAGPVVSVELLDIDSKLFVLSASTDHTVKLWTALGQPIGTFGQRKLWGLNQPPLSQPKPVQWGDETDTQRAKQTVIQTVRQKDNQHIGQNDTETDKEAAIQRVELQDIQPNKQQYNDADMQKATQIDNEQYQETYKQNDIQADKQQGIHIGEKQDNESDLEEHSDIENRTEKQKTRQTEIEIEKSEDVNVYGEVELLPPIDANQKVVGNEHSEADQRNSTILGSRYRERMERVRRDRRERRVLEAGLNLDLALRPSMLQCCPYQAINLPTINNFHLPDNLTQQMTSSKVTANSSEEFASRDPEYSLAPASRDRRPSKLTAGRKMSDENLHSGKCIKFANSKIRLPSIASSRDGDVD